MSNEINYTTRDEILRFLQDEENIEIVPYGLDITEGPESYVVWGNYSEADEPNEEDPFDWQHGRFTVDKGLLEAWRENEEKAKKEQESVKELVIELKSKFKNPADLSKFLDQNKVYPHTHLTTELLSDLISKT